MVTRGEEYKDRREKERVKFWNNGKKIKTEMKERIRDGEGGREGRMNRDWCQ